ncbi:DNA polymerase IV [Paenibacillus pasadenensis]|uniref:DNA polymerase IV n=1 Tax=Paenibacillus pasadenensis TaxID=217090 RepID=UPI00203F7FD4|nr:DNA polymerase IV [Paenibacillus pasadenensis]MCM3747153.1 DNA polymerase IV [Paenibacillus pasadenensis]
MNGNSAEGARKGRVILHLDMNAFYCSVHEAEQPELYKGKPTAVAGSVEQRKGIIVTCSYPARARGVRTGMTVRQGLKLCPELILISPDFDLYRRYSRGFKEIAGNYSPLMEIVSIDECYLDISGSSMFGSPLEIAETIQRRIAMELSLPCSVGIGPNKLLAKMGSDMKKPSGLTVLRIRDMPKLLWDKPCDQLFGVGRKTADKLRRLNIRTIGQLANADEALLTSQFGVYGSSMKNAANGIDHSPVRELREPNKSVGHTTTLPANVSAKPEIHRVLLNLADQTARRMRRKGFVACGVQITVRLPDMTTFTRSRMLDVPVEDAPTIHREACRLFDEHWPEPPPVRLLGITLHNLQPKESAAVQLDLFSYESEPKREALTKAMDALRDKYGESAVLTAGMLGDDPSTLIRNRKIRGTSLQIDEDFVIN